VDENEIVGKRVSRSADDGADVTISSHFVAVLERSRVWINGDEPDDGDATQLHDDDEVAVLPPVSGG
jgi:molybdopterin converting factor small subunit